MIKNYFTVTIRSLIRQKGYFLINLLGLTIGLTACLLITFYVIDELSYDKFHEKGDRIYRIGYKYTAPNGEIVKIASTEYRLRESFVSHYTQIKKFVRISKPGKYFIEYEDKRFYESRVSMVDKDFFDIFSFEWVAGDKNTALNEPYTAVITESTAKKYFGTENPINKTMTIKAYEEAEIRITGIIKDMPSKSHFHLDFMFSMESAPLLFPRSALENWGDMSVYSYVMIPEKVNIESIKSTSKGFLNKIWGFDVDGDMTFLPLFDIHLHSATNSEFEDSGSYRNILVFGLIAIFILAIASINYMNLTTARSSKRSMEVGIRKVLGATKQKLMFQFLGEAILITFIAFLISIALSDLIIPKFNQIANKDINIGWMNNLWIFGVILVASILIGTISGSYPAFFLSSFKPLKVLKERIKVSSSNSLLRKVLVITQFTISIILIVCTLIIFRQLNFIRNKPLGVDPSNIVFFRHPGPKYYDTFKSELLKNPNIYKVSTSSLRPTHALNNNISYEAEGVITNEKSSVKIVTVGYDFFETLGNKIKQGRSFNKEYREDENSTFIINESALELFGWDNAINKYLKTSTFSFETFNWVPREGKVVGVVEDFHFESLHNEIAPVVYFIDHNWTNWVSVKINAKNKSSSIKYITEQWDNLNIDNIRFNPEYYEDNLENLYKPEKHFFILFIIFSGLAISIACLGILGLALYTAEQRTKEIGIRKVMGASVTNIIGLINKEFLKLIMFSNLLAWPIAGYFMKNWLNNFVYRIEFTIWPFLTGGGIAILIALVSVSYQAFKASNTNPVTALRYE